MTAITTPDAPTVGADAPVVAARRTKNYRRLIGPALTRVGALALVLALWTAITAAGLVDPLYLPSPHAVWDAFVRANSRHPIAAGVDRTVIGEQNYYLWEHLLASLQRIAAGVGLAIVVGPPVGFLMGMLTPVRLVTEPILNFLRALPPLGYIGLLIVWFGIGDLSKVWLLFLAAFPPIAVATLSGVTGVKHDYLHAARALGAGRAQVITRVVLPATLPEVISGVRIATAFAWTTVVAAELNNGIPGIGGLAYIAGTQLNTPLTIACIIVIGCAALVLDSVIGFIGAKAVPWKGKV
ncbi:taurine transport system permease protein [Nocardia tenerifensis]|uniref:Taurine transport system permease protein n=1 Tax=Nocardia tenerifensis TaxID=228006 RepID=A0A318KCJ9_9NOCA|nr:ABC transporter permease [Nocardia tenerifensis]PXX63231.1 taurine transport system permease protein [Nocardia tenerifensis]